MSQWSRWQYPDLRVEPLDVLVNADRAVGRHE